MTTPSHHLLALIEPSHAFKNRLLNPPTPPEAPLDIVLPQIFGEPVLGNVLSCFPGQWSSISGPLTYTFQWARDNVDVDGETAFQYTYRPPDEFIDLTVKVTAHDTAGQQQTADSPPLILQSLVQLEDARTLHDFLHDLPLTNLITLELVDDLHTLINTTLPSPSYW